MCQQGSAEHSNILISSSAHEKSLCPVSGIIHIAIKSLNPRSLKCQKSSGPVAFCILASKTNFALSLNLVLANKTQVSDHRLMHKFKDDEHFPST